MTALLRESSCIQQRTETLRPSFTSPPKCLTTSAMETEFASELAFDLFARTTLDQSCAGIRSLLHTSRETLWLGQSYQWCCDDLPNNNYCRSFCFLLSSLWFLFCYYFFFWFFYYLWCIPKFTTRYLSLRYWHHLLLTLRLCY